MSDFTVEDARAGFASSAAAVAEEAMSDAREMRRESVRLRRMVTGGGWAVAAFMTVVATASLAVMAVRPVPQDRLAISLLRADGMSVPMLRQDMPQSMRETLLTYSLINYVRARESYSWGGEGAQWRQASAMSAPEEQRRYQAFMKGGDKRPEVLYGRGNSAGTAEALNVTIRADLSASNAATAYFTLRVTMPDKPPVDVPMTAQMTWMDAEQAALPIEIQQEYDPAGIAMTHYASGRL